MSDITSKLKRDSISFNNRFETFFGMLAKIRRDYQTVENSNMLARRVDEFAQLEHVQYLKETLLPKVQKFSDLMESHEADNIDMRQIIREFDKTISNKANKTQLTVLKSELFEAFISVEKLNQFEQEFN